MQILQTQTRKIGKAAHLIHFCWHLNLKEFSAVLTLLPVFSALKEKRNSEAGGMQNYQLFVLQRDQALTPKKKTMVLHHINSASLT